MQSDVWDIALDAMSTFERDERFANVAGEWTFWRGGNPYGVRSWREQNAEETGLPIWRILLPALLARRDVHHGRLPDPVEAELAIVRRSRGRRS